jgi:hypothetical protein
VPGIPPRGASAYSSLLLARDGDGGDDGPLTKCAPPVSFVQKLRRELEPVLAERNMTLWSREMTFPERGKTDVFMAEEVPSAQPLAWQVTRDTDVNTALFHDLTTQNLAWSAGTSGLCGCTTLIIISRRAFYGTHWWESISFEPDNQWLKPGETPDQIFQRTVLDGITKGNTRGSAYAQMPLVPGQIDDDSIRAYLIRPNKSFGGTKDGYQKQWDLIKSTITSMLPRLGEDGRIQDIVYNRLAMGSDLLRISARGKVLFKYDPDDNGHKRAVLWVEQRLEPYHDDSW